MCLVHGGSHHDRPQPGSREGVRRTILGIFGNLWEQKNESGDVHVVDADVVRGRTSDPQAREPKLVALGLAGRACEQGDIEHGRHDEDFSLALLGPVVKTRICFRAAPLSCGRQRRVDGSRQALSAFLPLRSEEFLGKFRQNFTILKLLIKRLMCIPRYTRVANKRSFL